MSTDRGAARLATAVLTALVMALLFQACALAGIVEQAQIQYDKGWVLFCQDKLGDAVVQWRKVDTDFSDSPTADPHLRMIKAAALTGLADALRQQGKPDEAIVVATNALARFSQFRSQAAEATITIAKCYHAKGDYVKATEVFKDVLKSYSDKINRAELAFVRLMEIQKKNAPELSPSLKTEVDAAIAKYHAAKAEDDAITAARRTARARAEAGDAETAASQLLALYNSPSVQTSQSRLRSLAGAQLKAKDMDNARVTINKFFSVAADELTPESYRLARLQVFTDLQDYPTVIAEAKEALEKYPEALGECEMRYYLGWAYDRLGDKDKCLAQYALIISDHSSVSDPDTRSMVAAALARSASYLLQDNKRSEAITMLRKAVKDYPETAMAKSATNDLRDIGEGGGL